MYSNASFATVVVRRSNRLLTVPVGLVKLYGTMWLIRRQIYVINS